MATFVLKICYMSNFYMLFVSLCFILRIQSTFLDIEELQKSKYGLEISAEPVLLLSNQDKDGSILQITSKHGQQYQCVLPIVHFETKESNAANVTTEEITKLLQPLNNTCIYQINGWWSYRVCFGRSVDQYHEEGHVVLDNISLGNFSGNTDWSNVTVEEKTKGAKRYHSQFYNNGTVCDLTGEPRKTEVRFYCALQTTDVISRIEESSTCNYVISIHTSKLCNHSLFRPPSTPKKHSITCSPALKEAQYKKYTDAQHMKSDITDTSAKMDHEENVKETNLDADLKTSEEKKTKKIMNDIINKQMKLIKKLKLPVDEYEDDVHSDDESDYDDDDVTVDEEGETYDEQVGKHVDKEDDLGWDVDDADDDNMDIEGSSNSFKKTSIFSNIKKDKKGDKSDHYHELIEFLKKQYHHFKKQLESIRNSMKKRMKRLEETIGSADPDIKELFNTVKKSVEVLEHKQRIADDAMKQLSDIYDTVMEDQDYSKANKELARIRSTLVGLIDKTNLKFDSGDEGETGDDDMDESEESKNQLYKPSEEILKPGKKTQSFDMEKPNLDKVVSKLKKMMTHENVNGDTDEFDDDQISVRVTKIKEKSEDIYDDKELERSFMEDNDGNRFDEINENEEMREATKKMESMVRKQLEDAGVKHEGKIKVKIITSKEALQRVAGGEEKFQILTSQETNQFRDLLSNLLGGTQQLVEEKRRQEVLEDNYNLVWNQDSFTSATVSENEDNDES